MATSTIVTLKEDLPILEPKYNLVQVRGKDVIESAVIHKFLDMIHNAYNYHAIPQISPDDIHLLITRVFADHVNQHEDFYRPLLADKDNLDGKTEIMVTVPLGFNYDNVSNLYFIFGQLVGEIDKKSAAQGLIKKLVVDYSTSTIITHLASQVTTAQIVEKYFSMRCMALCGIPAVDILGTSEDWAKLESLVVLLRDLAHPSIHEYLERTKLVVATFGAALGGQIIKKDVRTYSSQIDGKTLYNWNAFYGSMSCGSGGSEYYGWILEILPTTQRQGWHPTDELSTRVIYKFKVVDAEGAQEDVQVDVGPVGVVVAASPDSYPKFSLAYDYVFGPAITQGWEIYGNPTQFAEIDWSRQGIYECSLYYGKPIHEYISGLNLGNPNYKMARPIQVIFDGRQIQAIYYQPAVYEESKESDLYSYGTHESNELYLAAYLQFRNGIVDCNEITIHSTMPDMKKDDIILWKKEETPLHSDNEDSMKMSSCILL